MLGKYCWAAAALERVLRLLLLLLLLLLLPLLPQLLLPQLLLPLPLPPPPPHSLVELHRGPRWSSRLAAQAVQRQRVFGCICCSGHGGRRRRRRRRSCAAVPAGAAGPNSTLLPRPFSCCAGPTNRTNNGYYVWTGEGRLASCLLGQGSRPGLGAMPPPLTREKARRAPGQPPQPPPPAARTRAHLGMEGAICGAGAAQQACDITAQSASGPALSLLQAPSSLLREPSTTPAGCPT